MLPDLEGHVLSDDEFGMNYKEWQAMTRLTSASLPPKIGFTPVSDGPDFHNQLSYSDYVRAEKKYERMPWLEHIAAAGPWLSFLTLTFSDDKIPPGSEQIIPEQADKKWKYFIQCLNTDALGQHYVNKVGHSYFGYVRGLEYQRRGVVHFHALVDRRLNFDMAHRMWRHIAGYLWISTINDPKAALAYVTKYCTKGGQVDFYKPQKRWQFKPCPAWEVVTIDEPQPDYLQLDFLR